MTGNRSSRTIALLFALFGFVLAGWGVNAARNPSVAVRWSTATEFETAGFAVYRGESPEGPFEKISDALIPASGDPVSGSDYEFIDRDVEPGTTYYYLLEEVELSGNANREGPVESTAIRRGLTEAGLGLALIAAAGLIHRSASRKEGAGVR